MIKIRSLITSQSIDLVIKGFLLIILSQMDDISSSSIQFTWHVNLRIIIFKRYFLFILTRNLYINLIVIENNIIIIPKWRLYMGYLGLLSVVNNRGWKKPSIRWFIYVWEILVSYSNVLNTLTTCTIPLLKSSDFVW